MDASAPAATTRLHIRSALKAHLVSIFFIAGLGALLGFGATLFLPTTYVAQAEVLVQPLDGNPFSPTAQGSDLVNLETEAQISSSDVITQQVREALDGQVDQVNPANLRASVSPNTQIVVISYEAANADTAALVADEYAVAYLRYRESLRDSSLVTKSQNIQQRIDTLTKQLADLRRAERDNDDPEVRSIGGQLLNLRLQLATLTASDTSAGEVLKTAEPRRSGLVISPLLGLIAGLVTGAAIGAVLALLRERHHELLRSVDDVEHLGIPVLGIHRGAEDGHRAPDGQSAYDVAFLAGTILNRRAEVPATVTVASVTAGIDVGAFAEDLAEVLAHGREGVILIDAASSEPSRGVGFSDVLIAGTPLPQALTGGRGGDDPVDRVAIGHDPENGSLLYATSRMSDTLEAATETYDWVILQGPDTQRTSGRALLGASQYWVPVVALGRATRDTLERALAWSRTTGAVPLGVVVVQPPSRRRRWGRSRSKTTSVTPVEALATIDDLPSRQRPEHRDVQPHGSAQQSTQQVGPADQQHDTAAAPRS